MSYEFEFAIHEPPECDCAELMERKELTMRPEGAYWVWTGNKWRTAEWNGTYWSLAGTMQKFTDDDFERITAPIPQPWTGFEPAAT